MAAKLLPNRISKTPATDARDKIREAVRVILDALGTDTHITDEAYRSLRKIADKSKRSGVRTGRWACSHSFFGS